MRRIVASLLACSLLLTLVSGPARAAVNVERRGSENPMQEVAKSVLYGAAAGFLVGGAIALIDDHNSDSDLLRWGTAGGTLLGLGVGIWYVTTRPSGAALLEYHDGTLRAARIAPQLTPGRGVRMALVSARF